MLAGSPAMPPDLAEFGYLIIAIRPDLMGDPDAFCRNVADFGRAVRSAKPIRGGPPVRMPFDRSRRERAERLAKDRIEVADTLARRLMQIAADDPPQDRPGVR